MFLMRHIETVWMRTVVWLRHNALWFFPVLWWANAVYCRLFLKNMKLHIPRNTWPGVSADDSIRLLEPATAESLVSLLTSDAIPSQELFKPHVISAKKFRQLLHAPYYFALGYYRQQILIGYAFVHLYFPRKAFAGYYVGEKFRGQKIGKRLFSVLQSITTSLHLPLFSYVLEKNQPSVRVSSRFVIERTFPNGYVLLRHLPETEQESL